MCSPLLLCVSGFPYKCSPVTECTAVYLRMCTPGWLCACHHLIHAWVAAVRGGCCRGCRYMEVQNASARFLEDDILEVVASTQVRLAPRAPTTRVLDDEQTWLSLSCVWGEARDLHPTLARVLAVGHIVPYAKKHCPRTPTYMAPPCHARKPCSWSVVYCLPYWSAAQCEVQRCADLALSAACCLCCQLHTVDLCCPCVCCFFVLPSVAHLLWFLCFLRCTVCLVPWVL
jgi:hypothetical protein